MRYTLMLGQIALVFLLFALGSGSLAANLLHNPGFENPAGWSAGWAIRDEKGGGETYHYHLTDQGGGHGDARPRSGGNAIEIYSTDRKTYLVQSVHLESGTYRMSAWARLNGTPDFCVVEFRVGDKTAKLPLGASDYKLIWADFRIDRPGDYEVCFHAPFYGIALDDLCLEPVEETAGAWWPVTHIDLYPGSRDRGRGIQYCLRGSLQWVNFAVTCLDTRKLKSPVMRITATDPVRVSGINEKLIHHYRMREEEEVKVTVSREGAQTVYSFPLPRFVTGDDRPLTFGGLWVSMFRDFAEMEPTKPDEAKIPKHHHKLTFEIVDGDATIGRQEVSLIPVGPPKRHRTPKRFYVLGYAVQNWTQAPEERLKAMPDQFEMMGMNVWSDYGLSPEKPAQTASAEDLVRKESYERCGVRWFWPNFSSIIETSGGGIYSDGSAKYPDKDMYAVRRDGRVDADHYSFNFAANRGRAWMESSVAPWPRTIRETERLGLPLRCGGFINDGLEGMHFSYDPGTLAAFARFKGVGVAEVTPEKLDKEWRRDWLRFSMDLYARVVDAWAGEIRKVDPAAKIVLTASTHGPAGFDELSVRERMAWARRVDYNMPQWYSQTYYGSAYSEYLVEGEREGVFGKHNGGVDVIPLLNLSMGGPLEDPAAIRFRILEFLSGFKSVKGIGYYIANNAFCDARFMVELSGIHTLLADIEDYYADGVRDDGLVKLNSTSTIARVHKLNKDGRVALITVLTHADKGEPVTIEIDMKRLPNQGRGLSTIDRLTGRKEPLGSALKINTSKTGHAGVWEVTAN